MNFLFACRRTACVGAAVGFVAVAQMSVAVSAAPTDEPAGALTLANAVFATLGRNPDLALGAFELEAADARKLQAGLRPNPEASLDIGGFLGSGVARDRKSVV